MFMRRLILSLILCFGTVAFAEVDLRPDQERDAAQSVNVEVPRSQIPFEPLRFVPPMPTEFTISASSWVPGNFRRGTYANGETGFDGSKLPSFAFTRIAQFASLGSGIILADKLGIGYYGLSRNAPTTIANAQVNTSSSGETLNLFMARVGLEMTFQHWLPWGLVPDVSLSLMPTYGLAQRSALEDNVSAFGIPVEATAGVLWHSGYGLGQGSSFAFGVSAQAVLGQLDGSSMDGLGVLGEVRLTL